MYGARDDEIILYRARTSEVGVFPFYFLHLFVITPQVQFRSKVNGTVEFISLPFQWKLL